MFYTWPKTHLTQNWSPGPRESFKRDTRYLAKGNWRNRRDDIPRPQKERKPSLIVDNISTLVFPQVIHVYCTLGGAANAHLISVKHASLVVLNVQRYMRFRQFDVCQTKILWWKDVPSSIFIFACRKQTKRNIWNLSLF